jgi:hypothetical protein
MLIYGDFLSFDIKLSRAELARHQAGHAITAAVLGWPIEWVGINEAGGSGEVKPKTGPFVLLDEPFESRRRNGRCHGRIGGAVSGGRVRASVDARQRRR